MKLSRTLKMHRTSILFALPYLLLFAVFTVLPVVMSLILSLPATISSTRRNSPA